eukprot:Phypoly_transcript_14730.p1 GENE.Phypoly_transcript_14730~~Phypoly_transcript_14730.p1  ORF type:complete len:267 (+),score=60.41 Phypoly_transcript_14730:38-802(+)
MKSRSFVANSLPQLIGLLEDFTAPEARKELSPISESTQHKICFIFPGQGSQWPGCGVILYQTEPLFRSVVDTIDSYFFELSGKSLKENMFSQGGDKSGEKKEGEKKEGGEKKDGAEKKDGGEKKEEKEESILGDFDRCDVAQPLNFMIQVGLVEMCRSVGIHPTCMIGHSAGELAAAYASGAIPLKVNRKRKEKKRKQRYKENKEKKNRSYGVAPQFHGQVGLVEMCRSVGIHPIMIATAHGRSLLRMRLALFH